MITVAMDTHRFILVTLAMAISYATLTNGMVCPEDTEMKMFGEKEACCEPGSDSFERCFPRCDPYDVTEFTTKGGDVYKYHRMEECDCNSGKRSKYPPSICPAGMSLRRFEDPVDTLCCPPGVSGRQECYRYCVPHKGMNARQKYQPDIDSGKVKCLCFAGEIEPIKEREQASSASFAGGSILAIVIVGMVLIIFN